MVIRKLNANQARAKPYLVWNAFIDLLATEEHAETVEALVSLGLPAHADVLARATARWRSQERIPPTTPDHFIHDAELDEFGDLDQAFHACPQSITDALSAHLKLISKPSLP